MRGTFPGIAESLPLPSLSLETNLSTLLCTGATACSAIRGGSKFHDLSRIHQPPLGLPCPHDPRLCVINNIAIPASASVSQQIKNLGLDRHIQGRRGLVSTSNFGWEASAMAIITRCCIPPDIEMDIL